MLNEDTLALMIPIIAIVAPFLMIIIKTMTKHQREMAELYQRNIQTVDPRIESLQRDIADLKDLVHQQTIALDRMNTPHPVADLRERVGN